MEPKKRRSGFALLDPQRMREIASQGGKMAHRKGTAHEFSSDLARRAGRKGGLSVSADRAHMRKIGRLGGLHKGKRRAAAGGTPPAAQH